MMNGRAHRILLGTLARPLREQCKALQIQPGGMTFAELERINKSINLLWVTGILTEREKDNARKRMLRDADFKDVP